MWIPFILYIYLALFHHSNTYACFAVVAADIVAVVFAAAAAAVVIDIILKNENLNTIFGPN